MHFVRNEDVIEEVLTRVAFLHEEASLYLFPMQVVGVGEQVRVVAFAPQCFYQIDPPSGNHSDAGVPSLDDVLARDALATMAQHERKELVGGHLAHLIGRDGLAGRDALANGRCVLCVCFHEEQLGIDAEAFASLPDALHVEVEQHAPKVEDDVKNHCVSFFNY